MAVKPYITFFSRAGDADLSSTVSSILTAMDGNAHFPAPLPALADVRTAWTEFNTALAEASDGGMTLTAIKNARRAALVTLMRQLALYVETACKSDLAVLLSSGFPIQKPQRERRGILTPPTDLTVTFGSRSGELRAMASRVPGASVYNWQLRAASAPEVVLQTVQTTAARNTFTGLTPGVLYQATVSVVGSAGPSDWTGPVSQMAV